MAEPRRLIIHFVDGSKKLLEFPQQVDDATVAERLSDALKQRHLVVEADGALVIIPFENIRYLQAYPAPKKLPSYAIKGATFRD
jgi:hypothetical protein